LSVGGGADDGEAVEAGYQVGHDLPDQSAVVDDENRAARTRDRGRV
jgi:hypothetical protein